MGGVVMVSPAKITSPALGLMTLVIRLNKVDLPAPFGPISPRISPSLTPIEMSALARMPPKRTVSASVSSSALTVVRAACG